MAETDMVLNTLYRYELDKSSKKYICPNCGKKRAVRYIDNETGNYLPIEFSRCDRETSCGYWRKPEKAKSSMLADRPILPMMLITFIRDALVKESGRNFKENNFVQYLKTKFSDSAVKAIIKRYLIGTSSYIKNACVFWQIDEQNRVRAGKIMKYNSNTGKRIKGGSGIHWVLSILKKKGKIKDYQREQCFFGLHLINEYKTKVIAICESEKTACIMSAIYDSYLWLGCGSATGLQDDKFIPLKGRKIILYPDKGMYDKWKKRAQELRSKGYNVEVSDVVERSLGRNGCDIADYFVDEKMIEEIESDREKTSKIVEVDADNLSEEEKKLHRLACKNPKIINLIKTFDLTDTNGVDFKLGVLGVKDRSISMGARN
ncbi:DUF6371 domain-containing protein [Aquimarina sp. D1M17]|uniref:DUF6371 domain-containing protein n=1 Tax=Aquimarina acroporae TaxID=2937283 RepID=UPI0020BD8840|nr:DUF6371 domain-containing protein [Aquimarina acroporae]MCK8521936.1 DUF6371 domain-containing protein [Aquimarina acroporae]